MKISSVLQRRALRCMFGPRIMLLVLSLILVMAGFSVFFLTRLDHIVHGDLYRYGLWFSYEWAGQYWTYLKLTLGFLGVAMLMICTCIVLTLLQMRNYKTDSTRLVTGFLLVMAIVVFGLSLLFFSGVNHVVHDDLYRYGLQFSYEWANQYWIHSVVMVSFLGIAIGIGGISVLPISTGILGLERRLLHGLSTARTGLNHIKRKLCYIVDCLLSKLINILNEFFHRLKTCGCRVKTEVFKLLELPQLFLKSARFKVVIGVLVALIGLSVIVIGLEGMTGIRTRLGSSGKIITKGIGLYEDRTCSVPISELSWGMVEPGSTKYIEAYVRNEGNVAVKLYLYGVNWSPSNASSYIDFGWDYDDQALNPDGILRVTFSLHVSSDVQGIVDFKFDVIIDAIRA